MPPRPAPFAAVPPPRPVRADARRNLARLLAAAEETFAELGIDAPLEEVARRAEVGIATLYRHFPTREALLGALLRDGVEALVAKAGKLRAAPSPFEALATWLRLLVRHGTRYRGLGRSVATALVSTTSGLATTCDRMLLAGETLLRRAQAAGEVRADAEAADIFTLVNAIAWSSEQGPGANARADRLLTLLLDGLRAR